MKSRNSQDALFSGLVVAFLVSQVVLSILIVSRISNLESVVKASDRRTVRESLPSVPDFVEGVSVDNDPWKGAEDAGVIVVEFSDYQCPFCSDMASEIDELLTNYDGQIKFVYRDFPLEHIHPYAFLAAEAAHCAGDQGMYWEMHDSLFGNNENLNEENIQDYAIDLELDIQLFEQCLEDEKYREEVLADIEDGKAYQVASTPTFFVNGKRVVGAQPLLLQSIIEEELGKLE